MPYKIYFLYYAVRLVFELLTNSVLYIIKAVFYMWFHFSTEKILFRWRFSTVALNYGTKNGPLLEREVGALFAYDFGSIASKA